MDPSLDMMAAIDDVNATVSPPQKTKKSKKKSKKSKNVSPGTPSAPPDDLFQSISNPAKMLPTPKTTKVSPKKSKKSKKNRVPSVADSMSSLSESSMGSGSSLGFGSMGSQDDFGDDEDMSMGGSEEGSFDGEEGGEFVRRKRKEDIMQEKIEMLTRISKMSKQGFTTTKKWGMKDNIDEIRFECYRMTRESNSKKAVKNMQHALITFATILEFANNIVNPFNLKLQGFSKNMMLTVSDYDDSLEEIHHKWSGRTSIGPELTVLFTFATSAVFHHAGNVSSTPEQPTSREPAAPKKSGGLGDMSSMLGLLSTMMPKAPAKPAPVPVAKPSPVEAVIQDVPKKRRSMKGPSIPSASMKLPE